MSNNQKNSSPQLPDPVAPLMFLTAGTCAKLKAVINLLETGFDGRFFVTKVTSRGKEVTLRDADSFLQAVGSSTPCAMGSLSVDVDDGSEDNVRYKMAPAYVHVGGDSLLVEVDGLVANIGDKVWLKVEFTAAESNGVLFGSGSIGSVTAEQGSAMPQDDEFDGENATLYHYRILGEWISDGADDPKPKWVKDGCGSYSVEFCGGIFKSGFRGEATVVEEDYY